MDRFESMSVFRAVIEGGSLSAAARALGMPLATVSRRITELETHLQARLIHRTTRKLNLTDSGRAYLEACRRILEDLAEAERAAAGEYHAPRGELVLSAPIVFGRLHMVPVVSEFLQAYPAVDVRLVLGDRNLDLVEDHIDLALRIGALPDSRLIAIAVARIRRVLCASPAHFARHGTPVHPADLAAHPCVTFAGLMSAQAWKFTVDGTELEVPIHSRLVVNTAEAAIDAAIAGAGITRVLSYQVEEALQRGALLSVLREFEPPRVPASLVYPSQGRLPRKLRAFIDFAAPRLRGRLGGEGA